MSAYLGVCNFCGLIEIRDANDDVIYSIEVPCRLCSCGGLNVEFIIADVQGRDVSILRSFIRFICIHFSLYRLVNKAFKYFTGWADY